MHINSVLKQFGNWLSYVVTMLTVIFSIGLFRVLNSTKLYGKHNIPKKNHGVLFVSNHQTMYDSFFIGAIGFFPTLLIYPSRLPVNFAAKENYFGNWISRNLMALLRAVPVEGRRDSKLLKAYLRYLEDNNILIFYQGGRSYDLSRIRSGPGWTIAQSTDSIEVVPVYIEGVSKIFGGPKAMGLFGRWLPRSLFRKMVIAFGSSIDFSDISTDGDIRDRVDLINERIIKSIARLKKQHSLRPQTT